MKKPTKKIIKVAVAETGAVKDAETPCVTTSVLSPESDVCSAEFPDGCISTEENPKT